MNIIQEALREVALVPVEPKVVKTYTRPYHHLKLAGSLYRELSQWLGLMANVYTHPNATWDLSQAVFGGLLVRQFKLSCHLIDQVVAQQGELFWVTIRLLAEGVINLRYLLLDPSSEVIHSYVTYLLYHERDLKEEIDANIGARDGEILAIERRMLRSIDAAFTNSLVNPATLARRRPKDWTDKSLYQRAKALGLEGAYRAMIGGPSRNVHGNWYDLLQHHLEVVTPGQFQPRLTQGRPAPKVLHAIAHLTVPAITGYLKFLATGDTVTLTERLEKLDARIRLASQLHEEFLQRRSASVA